MDAGRRSLSIAALTLPLAAAGRESVAQELIDADPSVQSQVFEYGVHAFYVFYGGCVETPKRRG